MHTTTDDMQEMTRVNLHYPVPVLGSRKARKGPEGTRHLNHFD